jgi:hypothetical protein
MRTVRRLCLLGVAGCLLVALARATTVPTCARHRSLDTTCVIPESGGVILPTEVERMAYTNFGQALAATRVLASLPPLDWLIPSTAPIAYRGALEMETNGTPRARFSQDAIHVHNTQVLRLSSNDDPLPDVDGVAPMAASGVVQPGTFVNAWPDHGRVTNGAADYRQGGTMRVDGLLHSTGRLHATGTAFLPDYTDVKFGALDFCAAVQGACTAVPGVVPVSSTLTTLYVSERTFLGTYTPLQPSVSPLPGTRINQPVVVGAWTHVTPELVTATSPQITIVPMRDHSAPTYASDTIPVLTMTEELITLKAATPGGQSTLSAETLTIGDAATVATVVTRDQVRLHSATATTTLGADAGLALTRASNTLALDADAGLAMAAAGDTLALSADAGLALTHASWAASLTSEVLAMAHTHTATTLALSSDDGLALANAHYTTTLTSEALAMAHPSAVTTLALSSDDGLLITGIHHGAALTTTTNRHGTTITSGANTATLTATELTFTDGATTRAFSLADSATGRGLPDMPVGSIIQSCPGIGGLALDQDAFSVSDTRGDTVLTRDGWFPFYDSIALDGPCYDSTLINHVVLVCEKNPSAQCFDNSYSDSGTSATISVPFQRTGDNDGLCFDFIRICTNGCRVAFAQYFDSSGASSSHTYDHACRPKNPTFG